jgi:hypothetical protein
MISAPATWWKSGPPAANPLVYPFTKAVVPVVDIAGGRIVIAPPAEVMGDEREGRAACHGEVDGDRLRMRPSVLRRVMFRATILTLYPEMFPGTLGLSLAGEGLAPACGALRRATSAISARAAPRCR